MKVVIKENLFLIIAIIFLVLVFRSSVYDYMLVPSISMEPLLIPGDRILVNKHYYKIKLPIVNTVLKNKKAPLRGDIIIFEKNDGTFFVKRVIGVPGDEVKIINDNIFINNKKFNYKFNNSKILIENNGDIEYLIRPIVENNKDVSFKIKVPPENFFVLGDNRGYSYDSRMFGLIKDEDIIGRVEGVLFNFNKFELNKSRFLIDFR